jgi:hypothetical protein
MFSHFCGNVRSTLRESSQIRWPSLSKGLSNGLTTIGTHLARIEAEPIFESSIGTARPSMNLVILLKVACHRGMGSRNARGK